MITETDQIRQGLSQVAKQWPELAEQRTLLLRKVIEIGLQTIDLEASKSQQKRVAAVKKIAGSMDDVWPANWKEELAEDWPE
ncbi:MAG: hypothetical protein RIS19_880 [Actinomycetota bacterium]